MTFEELIALASTLVSLGIVFGADRIIGYSFIGAGVLLSIKSVIKSRKAAIVSNRKAGMN